jgi:hypothetical protein
VFFVSINQPVSNGGNVKTIQDYMAYFESLGEEAQRKRLAAVKTILADLEQERIDQVAGDLLADVHIEEVTK